MQSTVAVLDPRHDVPLSGERAVEHPGEIGIVLDQQDPTRLAHPAASDPLLFHPAVAHKVPSGNTPSPS